MLFSLQRQVNELVSSEGEFYRALSRVAGEGEIDLADETEIVQRKQFFNELYLAKSRDEDGEVVAEVSMLEILKNKLRELSRLITSALENKEKFGDLISFLEQEQRQVHDDVLWVSQAENSDIEGDLDVLSDWYNDLLTKTINCIDRIYQEPEL